MKDTLVSVFKDLYKSTDVPYNLTLSEVVERIQKGKSNHLISEIRKGKKELKMKLPSILFGGVFTQRNRKGLEKHSGLMVVDFDKYPDTDTMINHLNTLKENKHFVLLFISPSGNGIKGVVKIPECNSEAHSKYFKGFNEKYKYDYFDIANSNVDRVCFESYDPNIYVNYEAETFKCELIDTGYTVSERTPLIPITNEDFIIDKIMSFSFKKDFVDGERNNFVFDIAGLFCEYGVSQTSAENYILNNVVIGDFSERETYTTIKSAYRLRNPNSKYFEDYSKLNRIQLDLKNGKKQVLEKYKISESVYDQIKEAKEQDDFWYLDKKGVVKIDSLKYKIYLETAGFKKYFPNNSEKPTWVRVLSNKVSETSVEKIKDFVLSELLSKKEFDVWRKCVDYSLLFSEHYLLMLENIELLMLKDTKETSFITYQNGILKITKDDFELVSYMDVDGYVWESQIINRDFVITSSDDNNYKSFVNNIGNEEPLPIECVIGYLLSTYKNKMNNKAIILNDEVISENPEGGTGKGLFIQGLKQIRRVSILDGKQHDDKKSFAYQTVSQDCQVLVFDDVVKNFNFESKFSLVTEGITLERKNKDAIKLSVEESPKLVISTNYAIKGEGNSHDRRRHEIEIAQYYNEKRTPYTEFKRQLFDDWSLEDFNCFDNYMVYCLQMYLKNGLIKQNAKNIKQRKFIAETSMEFAEWVSDTDNVSLNNRIEKQLAFSQFTNDYKDYLKWLSRKKFHIWLKKYASYKGYYFEDGNTNGERWFMISDSKKEVVLEDEFNGLAF